MILVGRALDTPRSVGHGRKMIPGGEEIFDVVDEADRVVGQAPRSVVHARGWRHRAVHVWVFNANGEVFLQKRSRTKDMSPGLWDSSASGHLHAGEGYEAAAGRELGEELGLHLPAPPERWLRLPATEETGWEFCRVYRTRAEGPFVLHPEEIETGAWVPLDELARRMREWPEEFCTAFRAIWREGGGGTLRF